MNPLSLFSDTCDSVLASGLGNGTGGTGIIQKVIVFNRGKCSQYILLRYIQNGLHVQIL